MLGYDRVVAQDAAGPPGRGECRRPTRSGSARSRCWCGPACTKCGCSRSRRRPTGAHGRRGRGARSRIRCRPKRVPANPPVAGTAPRRRAEPARGVRSVALFEIGTVFRSTATPVAERTKAPSCSPGPADRPWHATIGSWTTSTPRAALEALIAGLGIASWALEAPAVIRSTRAGRRVSCRRRAGRSRRRAASASGRGRSSSRAVSRCVRSSVDLMRRARARRSRSATCLGSHRCGETSPSSSTRTSPRPPCEAAIVEAGGELLDDVHPVRRVHRGRRSRQGRRAWRSPSTFALRTAR